MAVVMKRPAGATPPTPPPAVPSQAPVVESKLSQAAGSALTQQQSTLPSGPVAPRATNEGKKLPAGDRLVSLGRDMFKPLSELVGLESALVARFQSNEVKVAMEAATQDPEKFIKAALSYVKDRYDEVAWARLVICEPTSIVDSVRDLAAVGLVPNSVKGTGFLVPRWDGKVGCFICTSLPGVRGVEEIIFSSKLIASITANTVREQDFFEAEEGANPKLVHRRKLGIVDPEANKIIGSYCTITATDGRLHVTVLPIQQKTIEYKTDGNVRKRTIYERQDTGYLNVDRIPADVAAAYAAQRSGMRKVGRTWLHNEPIVQALLNLEDSSYAKGEELDDSFRLSKKDAKSTAPVVRDAKVTISKPEVQASQGEQTETQASVAVTV